MNSLEHELDKLMEAFMLTHRFTSDPKVNALIRKRVESNLEEYGGYPSVTHFERAYLELCNEKAIAPFRGTAAEHQDTSAIHPDVINFIERASAFELRRRYANDKDFRRQYDEYAKAEIAKKAEREQNGFVLTVDEYKELRASEVIRRYRSEPAFRAAVDSLVKRNLI